MRQMKRKRKKISLKLKELTREVIRNWIKYAKTKEIKDILSKKGETKIYEKAHPFFNAGKTDLEDHKEIVFITKVDNKSHGK